MFMRWVEFEKNSFPCHIATVLARQRQRPQDCWPDVLWIIHRIVHFDILPNKKTNKLSFKKNLDKEKARNHAIHVSIDQKSSTDSTLRVKKFSALTQYTCSF